MEKVLNIPKVIQNWVDKEDLVKWARNTPEPVLPRYQKTVIQKESIGMANMFRDIFLAIRP